MKNLLLLLCCILLPCKIFCQVVYEIRADSVRIHSSCDTAELIIENHTRNILGFLYNRENGRTEFRKLELKNVGDTAIALEGLDTISFRSAIKLYVDTLYWMNDSLHYKIGSKYYSLSIPESDPSVSTYTKTLTSASKLLSEIETTDGMGSGLDADRLDGIEVGEFDLQKITDNGNTTTNQISIKSNSYTNAIRPFEVASNNRSGLILETNASINYGITGSTITGFSFRWLAHNAGSISYNTNTDELMRLSSFGNLGIGTSSPTDKLTIKDPTDGNATISLQSASNSIFRFQQIGALLKIGASGDPINILNTGKVGIGTTSPGAKLDVASAGTGGQIRLRSSIAPNAIVAQLVQDEDGSGQLLLSNINGTATTAISGVSDSYFNSAGGNVGIGITTPSQKLDVRGNVSVGDATSTTFNGYFFKRNFGNHNHTAVIGISSTGTYGGAKISDGDGTSASALYIGLGGILRFVPDDISAPSTSYQIWHAGNDGSGSGLNADSLDGIDELGFARAGVKESNIDYNSLTDRTFIGTIHSGSNGPGSAGVWYNLINIRHRNGSSDGYLWGGQIAFGMTGDYNNLYFRTQTNAGWRAWYKIWNTGNVTAGSGITVSGTSISAQNTSALWNSAQLQGRSVSSVAPAVNQVLQWNGSAWAPGTVQTGTPSLQSVTDIGSTTSHDITAHGFYQSSLRHLKRDIHPYSESALNVVSNAKIRTYYFKSDTMSRRRIGFIEDEAPPEIRIKDKGIDESNAIGVLYKAVQELKTITERQQRIITEQQTELEALKRRLKAMAQ